MKSESVRTLARMPVAGSSRSLTTARSVLRVLSMLVERPSGVRADEVAQVIGKSVSTAYYLLTSLCDEGFAVHESQGVYRPAPGLENFGSGGEETVAAPTVDPGLAGTVQELFLLTRRRSYLGVVHSGKIEIVAFHGRQGVPRMPGLGTEIRGSAHALAMGKVVLSLLDERGVNRYAERGLTRFTEHTITDVTELMTELVAARQDGYAVDREEFDENFCCVAAPIFDADGHFVAALGLSTSAHIFDRERDALAETVTSVARGATVTAPSRPARRRGRARRPALSPAA